MKYINVQNRAVLILKICGALAMLALLAACGDSGSTIAVTPTIQSGTVVGNTPGTGPTVITAVTVVPTGGAGNTATATTQGNDQHQVIALADRTLTISQVSEQAGSDASSRAVSLTILIANTSRTSIMNQATFYELVGAEGDAFGTQSSVSANFYGSLQPGGSRQGTIVFQVPTGAVKGLRLLYRPEVAAETVLIPLGL